MNWFGTSNTTQKNKNASKNASKNAMNASKNVMNATRKNSMNASRKNVAPLPAQMGGMLTVGSRAQVWHGTAKHTSGGLEKKDLMLHKGRIVSRKAHSAGKRALKHLVNAGYKAKKGTFKLFSKKH
jgi:hypothetical protein